MALSRGFGLLWHEVVHFHLHPLLPLCFRSGGSTRRIGVSGLHEKSNACYAPPYWTSPIAEEHEDANGEEIVSRHAVVCVREVNRRDCVTIPEREKGCLSHDKRG